MTNFYTYPEPTPNHVALPALAGLGMELGTQSLHGIQIKLRKPGTGNKIPQKLRHHAGIRKKPMVAGVMVRPVCGGHGAIDS